MGGIMAPVSLRVNMDCAGSKTIFDRLCFGTIQADGITAENCCRHGGDGGKKVGRWVLTRGFLGAKRKTWKMAMTKLRVGEIEFPTMMTQAVTSTVPSPLKTTVWSTFVGFLHRRIPRGSKQRLDGEYKMMILMTVSKYRVYTTSYQQSLEHVAPATLPLISQSLVLHSMLKFFRKGRKSLSRLSFFQRFRKRPITDSELGPTCWNLPLPPDIMNLVIDTYNDIPIDIPTILALAQSYPVLQPFCFSKIFQNLHISGLARRNFLSFKFLAQVIQVYPCVLDRVKSLTLEGKFKRKQLTGSSYVLSQITERSHNLVRLSLAHSIRTWEEINETLRKHILILLSQSHLRTVALCSYWIPIELLNHLPDLKRLEVDSFPERSALDVVTVRAREVKVEELALIDVDGAEMNPILHFKSPFDFSTLKVFEVHEGWMLDIQEIVDISAASLRKLVLDVCDDQSAYSVSPNIMI
jgi:hypothetical protein